MRYNHNIELIRQVCEPVQLAADEWYALMVVDRDVAQRAGTLEPGDDRVFFDAINGWLKLECMSDRPGHEGPVYISKKFDRRESVVRGDTWVVRVTDPNKCYQL